MDRPFREVHELYKIVYERAEAQQEAEKARKEKEQEEERKKQKAEMSRKPLPFSGQFPPDVNNNSTNTVPEPSPLEIEALEDALEDLM